MKFIKSTISICVLLLMVCLGMFLGFLSYEQGYTNGERDGSLSTAQYIAQACHQDTTLNLFGRKYHCGRVQNL